MNNIKAKLNESLNATLQENTQATNKLKISYEFFPPKNAEAADKLSKTVDRLNELNPEFVSITYGADGSTQETTFDLVENIKRAGQVQPVPHLTCVGATKEEIDGIAQRYWDLGLRKILALRGDPVGGAGKEYVPFKGGYAYAEDLILGLKKSFDFEVFVAAYPEVHPEAPSANFDLENLKRKFDAGASKAITQFFFDTDNYLRFRDAAQKMGIHQTIIPGIMPVLNFTSLKRFSSACGAKIPAWLHDAFNGLEDDPQIAKLIAANIAVDQIKKLQAEGIEDFQFYTLNQVDLTYAICRTLGLQTVSAS